MAGSLLIRDIRPYGTARTDLLIGHGRISAIGKNLSADGVPVLHGAGQLALPGLVEAHTHLDKSLLGMPWYRNAVGSRLIDKIDQRARRTPSLAD